MSHRIFPHGLPHALAENLWQVQGSLPFPVPRNMTIWRASDGRLVLYSVIAMNEEGMRALERLGDPAFMVIPHLRHHMDAPFYKRRYPHLRVLAETSAPANGVAIDASIRELAPLGLTGERLPGTDHEDIALDLPVPDGRALCVCELLSNVSPAGVLGRLAGRLMGPPGGHFGIARVVRFREVVDRSQVRGWLTAQAQRSDLRMLLVGHGPPVLDGVSEALARAATQV
jgi:hypothetical protein